MPNHEGRLRLPAESAFDLKEFLESGGVSARVVRHREGDVIYSQGDPCDSVFYVQKGEVKLAVLSPSGKEAIVAIFECGDFFGEGALSGQPLRLASPAARAMAVVRANPSSPLVLRALDPALQPPLPGLPFTTGSTCRKTPGWHMSPSRSTSAKMRPACRKRALFWTSPGRQRKGHPYRLRCGRYLE